MVERPAVQIILSRQNGGIAIAALIRKRYPPAYPRSFPPPRRRYFNKPNSPPILPESKSIPRAEPRWRRIMLQL
jgi:hypothetical protein